MAGPIAISAQRRAKRVGVGALFFASLSVFQVLAGNGSGDAEAPNKLLQLLKPEARHLATALTPYYRNTAVHIPDVTIGAYQNPVTTDWWFAGHAGVIKAIPFSRDASTANVVTVLDITDRVDYNQAEMGLNGMAFGPDFATTAFFYVDYIHTDSSGNHASRISRFKYTAGDAAGTKASEKIILTISQPGIIHKGGQILFEPADIASPDGKAGYNMYIPKGDGGGIPTGATNGFNDKLNKGQTITSSLGKIDRIFIKPDGSYTLPSGNLKDSNGKLQLAWAYGLRNPWKCSFNKKTGAMFCGDVGESNREEVDIITGQGNYGWRVYEGTRFTKNDPSKSGMSYIKPIYEFCHASDTSSTCNGKAFTGDCIIGGFVYNGSAKASQYAGNYIFAEYEDRRLARLQQGATGAWSASTIATWTASFGQPVSLAEDLAGELYIITAFPANIYLLPGQPSCPTGGIPNAGNTVCCTSNCGTCGGTGCETRVPTCPGGGANCCCQGAILTANKSCSTNPPPCVLP